MDFVLVHLIVAVDTTISLFSTSLFCARMMGPTITSIVFRVQNQLSTTATRNKWRSNAYHLVIQMDSELTVFSEFKQNVDNNKKQWRNNAHHILLLIQMDSELESQHSLVTLV
jgi:hypothetical protein